MLVEIRQQATGNIKPHTPHPTPHTPHPTPHTPHPTPHTHQQILSSQV
ncbi:hypothetical protein [Microcystis aeruginosa]|nr:hypothetical protein [Microcystis aeruginosa]